MMTALSAKSNKKVVLIVDDSSETLTMLNELLERPDMTILVSLGGEKAIQVAQAITPDVILLDAVMPGLDGFETCRRIKSLADLKHVPVIFMTGLSDTESIVKGFDAGGIDYLTKPINARELIARIGAHLKQARTTMSAKLALDTAGQSVLVIDRSGSPVWSTPKADYILAEIDALGATDTFFARLLRWLEAKIEVGEELRVPLLERQFTAVFFGFANDDQYLVRVIDESAVDEGAILKDHFGITAREADVFLWLSRGKTNREIAQILDISPRTVNKHLELLFKKIGVFNRTSAATLATRCLRRKLGDR
jgi:DNA-binding NarL/FixJ family response regulator